MRLGLSSPLAHDSAEDWAARHEQLGLGAVNFPLNADEPEERIDEYVEAAKRHGLLIAEVGIWRNAMSPAPEERKKMRDYCVAQLRLAERIGARCAVNVAGAIGPRWDGYYKENFTKETRRGIVEMVREIIDRAEIEKTFFALEPMPWMLPTGPEEYLELIEEVDRERFGVHMDIINMTNSMDRYVHAEDFVDRCAELLGSRIKSCHIKDIHLKGDYTLQLEECAPGQGEFPLRHYVEKMQAIDPDMPIILEHLNTDEEYLHYLEYLKETLRGL